MPRYDYTCPKHGDFERVAGYDDSSVTCDCGRVSSRRAVYVEQGVVFKGGGFTKSVLPPPGAEAQIALGKELKQRGWDGDRAIEEIRHNVITKEDGTKELNVAGMTRDA